MKFRSADPKLAAAIVNALAQAYIDRTLEFKLSASKEATDWLANQLNEQKEKVEESERSVQHYREQHAALSTEEPQVVAKLTDLSAMVTRARTERLQKELVYQQIVSVAQKDRTALQNFPAVAANVNVQRLRSELSDLLRRQTQLSRDFGQKWPEVQTLAAQIQSTEAKLDAELDNAVQVVANEVAAAVAQEQSLQQALNAHKGEALARNRTSIGFQALEREAASNRQIFDTLMQRAKETNISGQLRTNNIRIADEADPPTTPVWPNHRRNLLFALLGGAGFAIALAFGAEYLDNKLKSPEEIRDELGLRCLGLVPKLSAQDPENPMINNGVPAIFAEAFRTVRTNVLFSYENVTDGEPRPFSGGHEHGAGRRQDRGRSESCCRFRDGWTVGRPDRRRHEAATRPRDVSTAAGSRAVGIGRRPCKAQGGASGVRYTRIVADPRRCHSDQPRRAAELPQVPRAPGRPGTEVRLGDPGFTAHHGRDRCVGARAHGWRRIVRRVR